MEPTKITVDRRWRVYDYEIGKPIEGDQKEMADKEPTATEAEAMDATELVKVQCSCRSESNERKRRSSREKCSCRSKSNERKRWSSRERCS